MIKVLILIMCFVSFDNAFSQVDCPPSSSEWTREDVSHSYKHYSSLSNVSFDYNTNVDNTVNLKMDWSTLAIPMSMLPAEFFKKKLLYLAIEMLIGGENNSFNSALIVYVYDISRCYSDAKITYLLSRTSFIECCDEGHELDDRIIERYHNGEYRKLNEQTSKVMCGHKCCYS